MNTLSINLDVRTDVPDSFPQPLEPFIEKVLGEIGTQMNVSGEISVSLVSDEEIHELNRTYREVDRPTDVLSFSLLEGEDDEFPEIGGVHTPIGDIVVSVPTTVQHAVEYGHSVEREFAFLLVHGFLHIMGYDHEEAEAEREMFAIQENVLQTLGIARG
jgi:probable rRNA maturation factor